MSDADALLAGVTAADPADPTALLVAADWFADHGEPRLEFALRWAARHGKRPDEYMGRYSWYGPMPRLASPSEIDKARLPGLVWYAITVGRGLTESDPLCDDSNAFVWRALANALAALQEALA